MSDQTNVESMLKNISEIKRQYEDGIITELECINQIMSEAQFAKFHHVTSNPD